MVTKKGITKKAQERFQELVNNVRQGKTKTSAITKEKLPHPQESFNFKIIWIIKQDHIDKLMYAYEFEDIIGNRIKANLKKWIGQYNQIYGNICL